MYEYKLCIINTGQDECDVCDICSCVRVLVKVNNLPALYSLVLCVCCMCALRIENDPRGLALKQIAIKGAAQSPI